MKSYLPITAGLRHRKVSLFPSANIAIPKSLKSS